MKATVNKVVFFVLAFISTSSVAFAWGSATHAYIAGHLNNKGPILMVNQIYGSMGTDAFNYMFEHPQEMGFLTTATHCVPLPVWKLALLPTAKALAYGFVSHNNLWAADSTAHFPACPPDTIPTTGYIFEKGQDLEGIVATDPTFGPQLAALSIPVILQAEIFRDLAEFGVDILVKQLDRNIGQKVSTAALLRSPEFPLLLKLAYARGLAANSGISYQDAAKMIGDEESQFRQLTIAYGQALTLDNATAIQQISAQMAQLAETLLTLNGVPNVPPPEDLVPIIEFSINRAVSLCALDYAAEISNTIATVKTRLTANGISY